MPLKKAKLHIDIAQCQRINKFQQREL